MVKKADPNKQQYMNIFDWFEDGNTGSNREICVALGMNRDTVHSGLHRLRKLAMARIVDKRYSPLSGHQLVDIWGPVVDDVKVKRRPVDVSKSIASQPEFVHLWNKGIRHEQECVNLGHKPGS